MVNVALWLKLRYEVDVTAPTKVPCGWKIASAFRILRKLSRQTQPLVPAAFSGSFFIAGAVDSGRLNYSAVLLHLPALEFSDVIHPFLKQQTSPLHCVTALSTFSHSRPVALHHGVATLQPLADRALPSIDSPTPTAEHWQYEQQEANLGRRPCARAQAAQSIHHLRQLGPLCASPSTNLLPAR